MNNYTESKKALDKIFSKYSCAGDVIFKTAVQQIIEYGQYMYQDEEFIEDQLQQISVRHDEAEADGKILFIGRDFEMAIFNCTRELAEVSSYDLLIYIQKECYWSNEGGLDYKRAVQIAQNVMEWIVADSSDSSEDYDTFSNYCNIDDGELEQLGFGYLIPEEEEDDESIT